MSEAAVIAITSGTTLATLILSRIRCLFRPPALDELSDPGLSLGVVDFPGDVLQGVLQLKRFLADGLSDLLASPR